MTSASGTFGLPPQPGYRFEGAIRLENEDVFVRHGGSTYQTPFVVSDGCGGDGAHVLSLSAVGKVWSMMSESARRARERFQFSRALLRVDVAGTGAAFYNTNEDRVQFAANLVWLNDGTFLLAHEYGHAFHFTALLSSDINSTCNYHAFTSAHSLQCAYSEGFANFFSAILFSDLLTAPLFTSYVERAHQTLFAGFNLSGGQWCLNQTGSMDSCPLLNVTTNGALAEFAVSGFLYDLADDEETSNGSPGIDDDGTRLPLQWIGDVIRRCEVLEAGVWRRANGVDHLVYCFGRTLGTFYADGYFPTRQSPPTGWRATSAAPVDWNPRNVRSGWQSSLFVYGPPGF
jgi:hypothetical protein